MKRARSRAGPPPKGPAGRVDGLASAGHVGRGVRRTRLREAFGVQVVSADRRRTPRLRAMAAEVAPCELESPGSAAKVVFPFGLADALGTLGNRGYGHGFVVTRGRLAEDLGEWCQLLGVDFLRPNARDG